MTQIIKLRNIPTPVVDVVYVNVNYPGMLLYGDVTQVVPNYYAYNNPLLLLTELERDTGEIIYAPTSFQTTGSAEYAAPALGSLTVNARGF